MGFSISLEALIHLLRPITVINGPPATEQPEVVGISTDSRTIQAGNLFVALQGPTFDGHRFVATAADNGAIAAIVHRTSPAIDGLSLPILVVQDTLHAYQAIAHHWRQHLGRPIVAITGSVGKTTTKELTSAVLSRYGSVLKTEANFNNEIGVPKTLLQLASHHDYGVVEMGMRGLGEIAELTKIAVPNVAVITNVGTAHIGRLGSEEAIAQAKCELLADLPADSIAVLNADNPLLLKTAAQVWQGPTITYGLTGGQIRGQLSDPTAQQMTVFGLTDEGTDDGIAVPLPLSGQHNALNYLAAIAVTVALKLDWQGLLQGIDVSLPPGRSQRYALPQDIVVLDETYNAGVESMLASLQLLSTLPGQRHIAVLGTMKELGDWSVPLHQRVGEAVSRLNLDHLFILADPDETQALVIGADAVPTTPCSSAAAVVQALLQTVQPGDRLLFKASHSVGLDISE